MDADICLETRVRELDSRAGGGEGGRARAGMQQLRDEGTRVHNLEDKKEHEVTSMRGQCRESQQISLLLFFSALNARF